MIPFPAEQVQKMLSVLQKKGTYEEASKASGLSYTQVLNYVSKRKIKYYNSKTRVTDKQKTQILDLLGEGWTAPLIVKKVGGGITPRMVLYYRQKHGAHYVITKRANTIPDAEMTYLRKLAEKNSTLTEMAEGMSSHFHKRFTYGVIRRRCGDYGISFNNTAKPWKDEDVELLKKLVGLKVPYDVFLRAFPSRTGDQIRRKIRNLPMEGK